MSGFLTNADGLRLLIFGGKGGAGKTTSAAASAIHLARRSPQRKRTSVAQPKRTSVVGVNWPPFSSRGRSP